MKHYRDEVHDIAKAIREEAHRDREDLRKSENYLVQDFIQRIYSERREADKARSDGRH